MILAGVDLGKAKAAVALFSDGKLAHVVVTELKSDVRRTDQLAFLRRWVAERTQVANVIYIEEALIGRSVRASLHVAQTVGAVMSGLRQPTHEVPVSTWKKEVVGKGNASKELVSSWLDLQHPDFAAQCRSNQDAVDATCIGLYGVLNEDRAKQLVEEVR